MPPVSFFFPDRTLSVSEDAAVLLVAQIQARSEVQQAARSVAERIETEARRGRLAAPGQDLGFDHEEQQELLDALKATTQSWPEEDKSSLHELELALAAQLSQPEDSQT